MRNRRLTHLFFLRHISMIEWRIYLLCFQRAFSKKSEGGQTVCPGVSKGCSDDKTRRQPSCVLLADRWVVFFPNFFFFSTRFVSSQFHPLTQNSGIVASRLFPLFSRRSGKRACFFPLSIVKRNNFVSLMLLLPLLPLFQTLSFSLASSIFSHGYHSFSLSVSSYILETTRSLEGQFFSSCRFSFSFCLSPFFLRNLLPP
jgi:hypothetical protein